MKMESIMSVVENVKTITIAGLIAVGLMVQALPAQAAGNETLTVAGGCFWCVEADFEKVKGVKGAFSGFAGGKTANPSYKQVTSGGTGHYEAVQITFDPSVVSASTLLDLFFRSVDLTDASGQFCNRGQSYSTAIFATSSQKAEAEQAKSKAQSDLGQKIVTPILGAAKFYPADAYHQDYAKGKNWSSRALVPKVRQMITRRITKPVVVTSA
jgi:peptide-methionine (S)-S-oxide reductase